ncbi:MAG: ATP-binding cassette domain-containing protein [Leptospiraceae bacterium]|nr:ATP-binding cassette domain-containing protein [Leptospiraceae bacterium]
MIKVQNLNKTYVSFRSGKERLISALSFGYYGGSSSTNALKNINFEVNSGELVGVIGRNGAGKSTLLKILSKVSKYDSGSIYTKGSTRTILELGVGFNPELTAKENVRYNGLIIGYTKKEINELEENIFEFAGLTKFKDSILKNFSTGMVMRLGFALATAKRPDTLLVDEALSVGDAFFQQKCINRLKEFLSSGTSILVVSHDLSLLSVVADKIILLENGMLRSIGKPKQVIEEYMKVLGEGSEQNSIPKYNVRLFVNELDERKMFFIGEVINLEINFETDNGENDLTVGFQINDIRGVKVFGTNSNLLNQKINTKPNQMKKIVFSFPINFRSGNYSLGISIHKGENHIGTSFLWNESEVEFQVELGDKQKFEGLVYLPVECKVL